ncbi:MAG: 9-O-acetylesterase [Candidatus Aminicenantes bacterium]|nr:9-O-acetylesterase [Candidatus Aminicenantes bacterium]
MEKIRYYNLLRIILLSLTGISIVLSCKVPGPPAENIALPAIFGNNMVLQQGVPLPVWGKADSGGVVIIEIDGQRKGTLSDEHNRWQVKLSPLQAGGPHTMKICGADTTVFENVLVGEVWLCSGQSNMEWNVRNSKDAQREMNEANLPNIRMFTVQKEVSEKPKDNCVGEWKVCSPENVGDFSAVGYFFGRYLHQKLNVPIGMIHSSWGSTPAEAWTSYETLSADTMLAPIVKRYEEDLKNYPQRLAEYKEQLKKIEESGALMPIYHKDKSNEGFLKGWANQEFDDNSWNSVNVPGYWENLEDMQIDGAVWFRKEVRIPIAWEGRELLLTLGAIDDFDVTYFNGTKVDSTGKDTPQHWIHHRKYIVPGHLVKAGKAAIAVRIFDHFGQGGFGGPATAMMLCLNTEPDSNLIPLAGIWKSKIETALDPSKISGPGGKGLPQQPRGPGHSHSPAGLYNAMIHPLAPYAIKGGIWYQGETNAGRAYQYCTLLPAMIKDWRTLWRQGDFPFGVVQLANYMQVSEDPQESAWAELREAQLLTSLNDPNVGLATIIDIGEADDIHPKNKQDVGKRLALWALANYYDFDLEYSGPLYQSMKIEDDKITVSFTHTADGLVAVGDEGVKGFAIAGDDYNFIRANAKIDGNQVIVWSEKVKNPVAVRFAWADNPVCNLYNSEMLPAVPFRTDDKPETTYLNR